MTATTAALEYDDTDQLRYVRDRLGTVHFSYGYDAAGNREQETRPDGTVTTWAHTEKNAIDWQQVAGQAQVLFSYDEQGNLTSDGRRTFEWNGWNRLKAVGVPATGSMPAYRYEFSYDGLNRRNRVVQKNSAGTVLSDQRLIWCGQEVCEQRSSSGALVKQFFAEGFAEGFTEIQGSTTHRHYVRRDPLGALREVELADETLVEYGVDALGRRVRRSVDSTVTHRYLYHGSRVVAEVDGSGDVTSRYVYASRGHVPDLLIRGGVTYRLLTDPLGSVRRVVNVDSGVVAQRIDYDVWGKVVSDTSPGFQPFGFAGGLYDPLTGLVRFGARDYDAETGRWTAKDPIRFDGGDGNLYAYVGNDPVNRVDSSGLEPDDTFDTPDGAAADWAEHMSDVTGGDKGEWASDIYRTLLGEYSYTHLINCGSYNECQRPPFMKSWPLKKTAECHSHPLNEPGAEFVGDPDKQKAKNRRPVMDSYVRTGDGKLYGVFGGSGYALPLPLD